MSKADLKQEIRSLPWTERVELLEEPWREAETEHPELLDWQKELLDQRLLEAERHPEDKIPWEEARRRLARLAQGHG